MLALILIIIHKTSSAVPKDAAFCAFVEVTFCSPDGFEFSASHSAAFNLLLTSTPISGFRVVAFWILELTCCPLKKETKMNAQPERKFGVVVVGVGRAGSLRMRDLRSPHESSALLNLIGFVSRRELGNIDGVQQISLEDALSTREVEVAYICSESTSHEGHIRQFLDAGKHVLVEYPMTLSLVAAQELWALAEQKGKVLHEEHVELLMEEFAFLKKEVVGKELLKGSLLFTAGPLAAHLLRTARYTLPSAVGSRGTRRPEALQVHFDFQQWSSQEWCIHNEFHNSGHEITGGEEEQQEEEEEEEESSGSLGWPRGPLSWIEEKGPGLKRNRYLSFHFKSGSLENVPNVGVNKNIFLKDQNIFVQKLLGQVSEKELAAEKKRILHCLALAEEIQKFCHSKK
ncbi:Biliverdin reductase A [Heterocephalus glaber]|uniref:Biliverdin reductase A n=1 Tax=Heterocephalus glaber TaxID=10181 RepID=G5AV43_HETGA|nr:Biliverdin reductase A [Heterocephalus glaber]